MKSATTTICKTATSKVLGSLRAPLFFPADFIAKGILYDYTYPRFPPRHKSRKSEEIEWSPLLAGMA